MLEERGHLQPLMPIITNIFMARAVNNNKIQPKLTKAMNMHFHWLCKGEAQEQYQIGLVPGKHNHGTYWGEHYTPSLHDAFSYLDGHQASDETMQEQGRTRALLQGCVKPITGTCTAHMAQSPAEHSHASWIISSLNPN